jgi:hypothetical protein
LVSGIDCSCVVVLTRVASIYSEESAHLMNTLVTRHARRWEELKDKKQNPPLFSRRYFTNVE